MKKIIIVVLCLVLMTLHAQESDVQVKDPVGGFWSYSGKASLLFNQAAFSQWASGGVNNVSLGLTIDYEIHYKENGWSWDTKSSGSYGLSYIEGDKFLKKTNDRLEINSLLGKEFSNTWSSIFLDFRASKCSFCFEKSPHLRKPRVEHFRLKNLL